MPLLDVNDSLLLVIDAQPNFYRDRPDVDDHAFACFVDRAAWVTGLAVALDVPVVVTVERPERNGDTADPIARALRPDDRTFPKDVFGVTGNAQIVEALDEIGRRTAVLVGMETDVCVAHSAVGLRDLGFRVAAVTDALFAPGEAHGHGLERLRGCGAELISAKGLFYEWLPSLDAVKALKQARPDLARPPGFKL
jgi:nicotinamidase-related amidase